MNRLLLCLCLLGLISVAQPNPDVFKTPYPSLELFRRIFNLPAVEGVNGGIPCVACTVGLGIVEQLSQVNQQPVDKILDIVCSWLPEDFLQQDCDDFVTVFGPAIVKLFAENETPDSICNLIDICPNSTCRLFEKPQHFGASQEKAASKPKLDISFITRNKKPKQFGEWPWDKVANHKPLWDGDVDLFSPSQTLRGFDWRGADCNDQDATIYAGRKVNQHGANVDHNCNGIFGTDPVSGKAWEDILCAGTPQFGTIILGDSASAHFHVPPDWVTPALMNSTTFSNLLQIAEDELDWPGMSSATGFYNNTWVGHPDGPVDSGYLRTRARNLCSHRDYQNIAVNGARSGAMTNIVKTMARNQTFDQPAYVTYALIGNDVCNGHHTFNTMTTPAEFKVNILEALEYLDTVLPAGSHVIFIGLADGRLLYEKMSERYHPIGQLNENVRYRDFYDYLNCLEISPCWGWMNSDENVRNGTSARAAELSLVYPEIIANYTFKNFDMHYYDCPLEAVIKYWEEQGGPAYELIEPVDGFHPTQISDALSTMVLYELYQKDGLQVPINPNNAKIAQLFGDQGGYGF